MVDAAPAPIQTLPPAVAARIAAGEVIERPLSIVRELLDNALDAGARRIAVEVEGGGRARITVADDGCGIAGRDLRLAVERYSTSKIGAADDLLAVRTLGFRGEALASVAVAADLTIISAPASGRATEIVVAQGRVCRHGPAARAPGTTVTARHLFRDLPARLSALVAAPAENAAISRLVRTLRAGLSGRCLHAYYPRSADAGDQRERRSGGHGNRAIRRGSGRSDGAGAAAGPGRPAMQRLGRRTALHLRDATRGDAVRQRSLGQPSAAPRSYRSRLPRLPAARSSSTPVFAPPGTASRPRRERPPDQGHGTAARRGGGRGTPTGSRARRR